MIWACFSGQLGRSELFIMVRDPDTPKGGYSVKSYTAMLEEIIPIDREPCLTFMQDNAPIHKVQKTMAWLAGMGIPLED